MSGTTKNRFDYEWLSLLTRIFTYGQDTQNRTGIMTRSIFGELLYFDMREGGFPALTVKQLHWKPVVGELLGFLRGYTSAAQFRELGCKIWDANANRNEAWLNNPHRKGEDDLGPIYGAQWRNWPVTPVVLHGEGNVTIKRAPSIDQLVNLITTLRNNPTDRRMIVTAWNPEQIPKMALPPCHCFFQCYVTFDKRLDMCMYQRSVDTALGLPFNIASYALLIHILCGLTGYEPGKLTMMLGDCHVYHNHFEPLKELNSNRPSYPAPKLQINWPTDDLDARWQWICSEAKPKDFVLVDYQHHPEIKLEMAV